jgi:UrcA family protein
MYRFTMILLLSVLGFNNLAGAAPPSGLPNVTVHFADLDLTSSEGAARLLHRLQVAARTVCGSFDGTGVASVVRFKGCVGSAVADAVAKVDRPAVTLLYSNTSNAPAQIAHR